MTVVVEEVVVAQAQLVLLVAIILAVLAVTLSYRGLVLVLV